MIGGLTDDQVEEIVGVLNSERFCDQAPAQVWATLLDEFTKSTRPKTEPETTGETGDGVWSIYTVDEAGGAHIEEVYPTELDALRANKNNTTSSASSIRPRSV